MHLSMLRSEDLATSVNLLGVHPCRVWCCQNGDPLRIQMPAVRQVDIRILNWTAVLLVPPRLMDWYVQTLPLRWRAASRRRRRKSRRAAGRARTGGQLPPPLATKKTHGGLGLLGFLVAGEGAPRGEMWMGVESG